MEGFDEHHRTRVDTNATIVLKSDASSHGNTHDNDNDNDNDNNNDDNNDSPTSSYTPPQQTALLLDLAQIHTRLGDLQRANANVLPSLDDYNTALRLRLQHLGRFHRQVADAHFSLAGAYAEAPTKLAEEEGRAARFVRGLGGDGATAAAGAAEGQEGGATLSEEEKGEFRARSREHYLACGVAFAGLLAKLCGDDAEELTAVDGGGNQSDTMAALRRRVAALPPPSAKEEFQDLTDVLDEIQEALDTAEETEAGLRSLGAMKQQEMRKHEKTPSGAQRGEGGQTTTVGFGGGAGAVAAATAPTLLVVKKKKKKPSAEEGAAKRNKGQPSAPTTQES